MPFIITGVKPKPKNISKEDEFLYDFAKGYLKKNPPPPRPPKPLWRKIDNAVTLAVCLGIGWLYLITGEMRYPDQPLSTASKALQAPAKPHVQHAPYTDVFAARIPLQALAARVKGFEKAAGGAEPTRRQLEEAWARSLFGSKVLRREACVAGLFTRLKWSPGDIGDSAAGFASDDGPRELMNGVMRVEREIGADEDANGLLLSWRMPDAPRVFFETIAGWGSPWRLMSGGRYEMSVSEPYEVEDEEGKVIDVRLGAAHDYEIVHEEGDLENQKILPRWVNRLLRGHSRLMLGSAVIELHPPPPFICRGGSEFLEPEPDIEIRNGRIQYKKVVSDEKQE